METTVTSLTGNAGWPALEGAAGAEGFPGVLADVAGGAPGAAAAIALSPTPAWGRTADPLGMSRPRSKP